MDLGEIVRMVFALALTLGLIGLATVGARRFAPGALLRMHTARERRMKVVESLLLDPARRLVIVRCDDQEHVMLLGEGKLLSTGPARPELDPPPPPPIDTAGLREGLMQTLRRGPRP
jgi:flagellar protein FliO/FliZ